MDKRKKNLERARSTYENKYHYKCVVRLTEEEYEMINKKRAGHSIAEYLKIAGMKRRITKHRVSNLSSAFYRNSQQN